MGGGPVRPRRAASARGAEASWETLCADSRGRGIAAVEFDSMIMGTMSSFVELSIHVDALAIKDEVRSISLRSRKLSSCAIAVWTTNVHDSECGRRHLRSAARNASGEKIEPDGVHLFRETSSSSVFVQGSHPPNGEVTLSCDRVKIWNAHWRG